jgi:hypothetical protein
MRDLNPADAERRSEELAEMWDTFVGGATDQPGETPAEADRGYTEPLFRTLEGGGDEEDLLTELRILVPDFAGIDWTEETEQAGRVFASRIKAWWDANWADTVD